MNKPQLLYELPILLFDSFLKKYGIIQMSQKFTYSLRGQDPFTCVYAPLKKVYAGDTDMELALVLYDFRPIGIDIVRICIEVNESIGKNVSHMPLQYGMIEAAWCETKTIDEKKCFRLSLDSKKETGTTRLDYSQYPSDANHYFFTLALAAEELYWDPVRSWVTQYALQGTAIEPIRIRGEEIAPEHA